MIISRSDTKNDEFQQTLFILMRLAARLFAAVEWDPPLKLDSSTDDAARKLKPYNLKG